MSGDGLSMDKKQVIKKRTNPSPTVRYLERPSPLAFFRRRLKAGMTVEAALVLPLCLFFLLNLGCVLEVIRLHNNLQLALLETGSKVSLHGAGVGGNEAASLLSGAYVHGGLTAYLGTAYLDGSPLTYGSRGLQLLGSGMLASGDELDITLTYSVSPMIKLVGFGRFRMVNHYYAHLWNGYDVSKSAAVDERVFVAQSGEVWHRDRNCTYLQLSVRQVRGTEIGKERNQWGRRYDACGTCAGGAVPNVLYVTSDGNSYHHRPDCPGIKRTVRSLTKGAAEERGYRRCSRCGGLQRFGGSGD